MSQPTPGPWTLIRHDDGHHLIAGPDNEEVAEVLGSEADALLLAAAPDLYEVCEQFLTCLPADMSQWRELGIDTDSFNLARVTTYFNLARNKAMLALAKARGNKARGKA